MISEALADGATPSNEYNDRFRDAELKRRNGEKQYIVGFLTEHAQVVSMPLDACNGAINSTHPHNTPVGTEISVPV